MPLPNPFYIDAEARHLASTLRVLAHCATEGQQGVLHSSSLAVSANSTPNGQVLVAPGPYTILARHTGGAFESYIGKLDLAEAVSVNPTDSSGPRTDLVIARVENPYVTEPSSWAQPPSALNGPYAHIRVVEGVPANTNDVTAWNNTWSAIVLARITRPANTGIVTQAHITDLRSLAKLDSQRIIIVDSPPPEAPPIAQQYWTESTPCAAADTHIRTQTSFHNFPSEASWQVPVPAWATGFDLNVVLNPELSNHIWGEFRLVINNGAVTNDACGIVPAMYDVNFPAGGPGPVRETFMIGGTGSLVAAHRGKVVNMRLQARSLDAGAHPGIMTARKGTRVNVWVNFKRNPSYSP